MRTTTVIIGAGHNGLAMSRRGKPGPEAAGRRPGSRGQRYEPVGGRRAAAQVGDRHYRYSKNAGDPLDNYH